MSCHFRAVSFVVATLALLQALAAPIGATAASELLQSRECTSATTPLTAWQKLSGVGWECCDTCDEGNNVVSPGGCSGPECVTRNNPLLQELVQVIDVSSYAASIDTGTTAFALKGSLRTFCGIDAAVEAMSFLDASGSVLGTHSTCRYQDSVWGTSVMVEVAPSGTRTVRVHLIAEARGGNDADAFFDNLSLLACTPGADCPTAQTLECPKMVTSVTNGAVMDDLLRACPELLTVASAAGVDFPVAIRSGYCTVDCNTVLKQIYSDISGAKDPTCDEFPVIESILLRELSIARRKCKNPLSNDFVPRSGGRSLVPRWAWQALSVCVATLVAGARRLF